MPKAQKLAWKVLESILWDARGIILIDYLEKGKSVTIEYHAALLDRLNQEIKKKRLHMAKKKCAVSPRQCPVSHIHENDGKIEWNKVRPSYNFPYSPDLSPSDYYLFLNLKIWLQKNIFPSYENVECETGTYLEPLEKSYYKKGIEISSTIGISV